MVDDYNITETDLSLAVIEGKQKAYGYIHKLITKGYTTGQIMFQLNVEFDVLNDMSNRLQDKKDKEIENDN